MNEDINNTTGGTNPLQEVLEQADKIILDPMLSTGGIGKTASVKTSDMDSAKKVGGVFLKQDDVSLPDGNYVNKDEILEAINNYIAKETQNRQNTRLTIKEKRAINKDIKDLLKAIKEANAIVLSDLTNKVKNQDARLITQKDNMKNIGGLFLGNNSIELKNGEYVNAEEIMVAITAFMKSTGATQQSKKGEEKYTRIGRIEKIIPKDFKKVAIAGIIGTALIAGMTTFMVSQNLSKDIPPANDLSTNNKTIEWTYENDIDEPSKVIVDYVVPTQEVASIDTQQKASFNIQEEAEPQITTPTIGDVIHLDEGDKFYVSSGKAINPTGSGGFGVVKDENNRLSPSGAYTVTGIALVDTNTGKPIEFRNMEAGVGLDQICEEIGLDHNKLSEEGITVAYHVNQGAGLENNNQRGWIKYDPQTYQILEKYQTNNMQMGSTGSGLHM